MFPRASVSNSRRLVGLLALVGVVALSTATLAQARSTDRPSTRHTAVSRLAPAENGLFGRFLSLLKAVWQADSTTPPPPGPGGSTSTEGSGIDPHGNPKPKP
jgi:hypothetical protein